MYDSQNVAFGDYARPAGGPPTPLARTPPLAPLALSPPLLPKVCIAKQPQLASLHTINGYFR